MAERTSARGSRWLRRSRILRMALLAAWAFCASLVVVAWQPHIAHAEGSVTYEQRNYAVAIQRNGAVRVAEHWQVHFTGGPFHHAFLALYLAKTSGITYGQVSGDGVSNQQVSNTTDASGNPMIQVAWDYPETTDATRTFDIPYTIQGALGLGSTQAWLDWHFLDGGSTNNFPINSAEIRITLPEPTDGGSLMVNTSDSDSTPKTATPDARTVIVTAEQLNSNVPLEVEVAFPRSQIDASVTGPAWQKSDTPPTLPTVLGTGQSPSNPGSYDPGSYNPDPGGSGPSTVGGFNPLDIFQPCLGVCALPVILLVLSALGLGRAGGGWGFGNGNRGYRGPWYRGPWMNGGGPWTGGGGGGFGGGFGGGSTGGGGGGGGGSSGFS